MRILAESVAAWLAEGEAVALATVVATAGASPQPVGTKMAVNGSGQITGAVSGGCVEGAVVEAARAVLAGAPPRLLHFGDELVGGVGLPCGGEISVWVEPIDALLARFLELARRGEAAILRTRLTDGRLPVRRRLLVVGNDAAEPADPGREGREVGREGHDAERDPRHPGLDPRDPEVFVDVAAAAPRLMLIGAVAVAAELSALAARCGWRVLVADPRASFTTRERFPDAAEVRVAWPAAALARWRPGGDSAVAVLSHDRKIDDEAVIAALGADAAFVGAIGSRRAAAARARRLLAGGLTPQALARLASPIGLDLGAAGAADTALSILAEIVAVRHGRAGGRLRDGAGPIHAGPRPALEYSISEE